MRALVLTKPSSLELRTVADPTPLPGEELLEVELTGIGGGEINQVHRPTRREFPHILGHGIIGELADRGRVAVDPVTSCGQCSRCVNGRRQHCSERRIIGVHRDGGFAELVAIPSTSAVALPENISAEQAMFIEPFANALHSWHRAEVEPSMTIGVVGAGGIGLGVVAVATAAGHEVTVAEMADSRGAAASRLGATTGAGLVGRHDIVFDTVGSPSARTLAVEHTAVGGTVVLLGLESSTAGFDTNMVISRELRLQASYTYTHDEFVDAIALVSRAESDWVDTFGPGNVQEIVDDFSVGDYRTIRAAFSISSP